MIFVILHLIFESISKTLYLEGVHKVHNIKNVYLQNAELNQTSNEFLRIVFLTLNHTLLITPLGPLPPSFLSRPPSL